MSKIPKMNHKKPVPKPQHSRGSSGQWPELKKSGKPGRIRYKSNPGSFSINNHEDKPI
jgi:hypothetical protein